ncbi:FAD binding domain-containing protein [Talaromyces proteolyticus]|uniref:FAD binding domain-containing protein n=1 Tax=Talaromyces proteolyticus TaxID=1131652 RepID=A0AAD4KGM6_9EURO|nr:FAD binding domain-containing protein [Talaromyces proteolyticus]KAH8691679.1 FAD binding domain-containing protein [Talaromyces proteolyticus]
MTTPFDNVLVVGAGPSGLLLALMLGQHGIKVDVVEALDGLDKRPRGVAYGPAAAVVLHRANVLSKIREVGLTPDSLTWRKLDGTVMNGLTGLSKGGEESATVIHPAEDLSRIFLEEVYKQPSVTVHWSHKVISVGQNEASAWVDIEGGGRFEADFVVGCDGASSAVRKSLFGQRFDGKTWDKIIMGTNLIYDFKKFGWEDTSWIIHPEHFAVICQITQDGVWRVSYGEDPGLSREELQKRMPGKLQQILPGAPSPDKYHVLQFNPYVMHQRCAERMRVGRILLAADAAHLCNPMGGLGLTTGIADIGSLVDCFYGIYEGKVGLDILDKYDESRRNVFHTVTDVISTLNLNRVRSDSDSLLDGKDPFFALLDAAKKDPSLYKRLAEEQMKLAVDLTCFYN